MRNHGLHHCRARPWEPGKYATKADQDAKLPLLLDWVRAYSEIARYQSWTGCTAAEAAEFVRCHQAREFGVPGEWLQIAIAHQTTNEAGEAQDLPGE